jgi:hypothetical protein
MVFAAMSAKRPALPMSGGCSCGTVRYRIASFPLLLYTCNCNNCQRASGSAFALNMPVWTKDFQIVQGEPKAWRHLSPSGVPVISWFCGDCSARLYGERKGREEIVNVRAGTLDDTSWLVPVAHTFMESAQPWFFPQAGAERHETDWKDIHSMLAAWRAMWPDFFPQK